MVAPFSIVHAEYLEYYESNGEEVNLNYSGGSGLMCFKSKNAENIKAFIIGPSNWKSYKARVRCVYISDTPNAQISYYIKSSSSSNIYTLSNYSETYGVYYYIFKYSWNNINTVNGYDLKMNIWDDVYGATDDELISYVMTGMPPTIELGYIEDVKYSTSINSHGDDSVDTISWYPYFDSNNNPAVGWNAQIRVVPGYYYDSNRDSLLQQAFNLFHKEEDQAELIYDDHFVQGSFSITWGDVRNKISITSWQDLFGSFVNILDGSYWYKRGWIYQIRIYDRDNNIYSEWQDVYTATSSSGEGVEHIIDPSSGGGLPDYYNNVENSFNTTSVVNNNYNVIYYYINTPIETNPSDDDSNEYLKDIRNNVRQIRRMLAIDNSADATPNNDNDPWHGNPAADLYSFEDSSINDFNDAVSDLPTSNLITGNKFLAASTWVRTQYETLVSNTPFEAVIIFSLLLGFGLLLIGKLR